MGQLKRRKKKKEANEILNETQRSLAHQLSAPSTNNIQTVVPFIIHR